MRQRRLLQPARVSAAGAMAGVIGIALSAFFVLAAPAWGSFRGHCNGRIAFDSLREGSRHVYALDAPENGRGAPAPNSTPTQLTSGPDDDAKPSWAPPL
jgi:hypothetical protein